MWHPVPPDLTWRSPLNHVFISCLALKKHWKWAKKVWSPIWIQLQFWSLLPNHTLTLSFIFAAATATIIKSTNRRPDGNNGRLGRINTTTHVNHTGFHRRGVRALPPLRRRPPASRRVCLATATTKKEKKDERCLPGVRGLRRIATAEVHVYGSAPTERSSRIGPPPTQSMGRLCHCYLPLDYEPSAHPPGYMKRYGLLSSTAVCHSPWWTQAAH